MSTPSKCRFLARTAAVAIAASAAVSIASAGEVFGKVLLGTAPVEGVSVTVKCGDQASPAAKTDAKGAYHLVVDASGKCTMSLQHQGQSASLEVASYDDPVQVDVVLEMKDGKLAARRK